ncbi:hypothetical protein [Hymenobacter crusticola]|nr:hypothetical protein [Hymenobacter crusticola]
MEQRRSMLPIQLPNPSPTTCQRFFIRFRPRRLQPSTLRYAKQQVEGT